MLEPHELAEIYFNRDPYPDFGFDLQLVVKLVAAQIVAAPNWAAANSNPGTLEEFRKTAVETLGLLKRDLAEVKNIKDALDEHRRL